MNIIVAHELPASSLLLGYRRCHAYTDGFYLDFPGRVSLTDYIEAFYTTGLFKLERLVLTTIVGKPSSDAQAKALAEDRLSQFAAWSVENRESDQIILCDYLSKTRSWLMCAPAPDGTSTRLYFGSAIMPRCVLSSGQGQLSLFFRLLLPFHKVYARALLNAAGGRLRKSANAEPALGGVYRN